MTLVQVLQTAAYFAVRHPAAIMRGDEFGIGGTYRMAHSAKVAVDGGTGGALNFSFLLKSVPFSHYYSSSFQEIKTFLSYPLLPPENILANGRTRV